jgi:predicted SnoaL-like aldol condensation-catalyzing enzyme
MTESNTQKCKEAAVQFLQLVTSGRIEEAYQKYVSPKGMHHNCFFPAGFSKLKEAMIENHKQFPVKRFTVKNVIGDGNTVAVHSHLVTNEGENGMVTVHIFRFEGDKVVEFWDCGQQIPADMPNKDGAF